MATEPCRVLVAGKVHEAGVALLRNRPDVAVDLVEAVTTEAYRPFLGNADAVLIRTQPMTAADIALAPKLKGVGVIVGVEPAIEQFSHARFDLRQKFAGDGDARAFDALKLGHADNPMARRKATSSYHP